MGAMADAMMAYVQPLLDQTDGSIESLNKALTIGQMCYNLALLPEKDRENSIAKMRQTLKLDDGEFADFRHSIIDPMIRRHEEMFPRMHQRRSTGPAVSIPSATADSGKTSGEKYAGIDRYAPCPCGSGEKYKFCCGAKRR